MSKEITNPNLTFLESADDTYIGAFDSKQDANTFDALFAEAVDKLESKQVNYFMDATAIVKSPAILKELKKTALSGIMQELGEILRTRQCVFRPFERDIAVWAYF